MAGAPDIESVTSRTVRGTALCRSMSNAILQRRQRCWSHRVLANFPRCPVCGSYDVQRHAENFKVWFSCRRCGKIFTR